MQSLCSDADEISIKLDFFGNNINYNVRILGNGDDGWDSFGGYNYVDVDIKRYMIKCLSISYGAKAFDQNNCGSTIELKNTVGFDNGFKAGKPNYMMNNMTAIKFENAVSFDGNVEALLPFNSKGVSGKFAVISTKEKGQREIRDKVDKTFNKIVDAVLNNKILDEVFFDIYNY